jgi:hypothetical protein
MRDRTDTGWARLRPARLIPALVAGLALGAALMLAPGWASGHAASPRVWAASPYVKLQATTQPAAWRAALEAPRGGRAFFQVVVDDGPGARPAAAPLRGPGNATLTSRVQIERELTVPISETSGALGRGLQGGVPDPLVPVSVKPQAGTRQVFWISIAIPRAQRPGLYRGSIRAGSRSVAYSLRVATVTLPQQHALRTWFLVWGDHANDAEGRQDAAAEYTRLLARWGVGDGTAAGGDLAIGLRPDSLDGDESDARLRQLAQRVERGAQRLKASIPAAIPYSYVYDEPPMSQLDQVRRWGGALGQEAPGVRQLVTAPPDPSLGHSVGAWAMHLVDLTPSALATSRSLGAEAWVYSSCCESRGSPTLLLDQDAVGNLAVAPASWLQGGAGLLYWSVNDYTGNPSNDPVNPAGDEGRVDNGDGVLLYPGRPLGLAGPNPSVRLALVAAGLQIADEAALLARRGHGDQARAILARVLPGTASFVDSPAAWQAAEHALLRQLAKTS